MYENKREATRQTYCNSRQKFLVGVFLLVLNHFKPMIICLRIPLLLLCICCSGMRAPMSSGPRGSVLYGLVAWKMLADYYNLVSRLQEGYCSLEAYHTSADLKVNRNLNKVATSKIYPMTTTQFSMLSILSLKFGM
jgi:hypothetical protein